MKNASNAAPLLCGLFLATSAIGNAAYNPGDIAANFTLPNRATGEDVSLYDYEGYVIILDFFAYWCGPCQTSSPSLETNVKDYYESLSGNPNGVPVMVIAINMEPINPASTNQFITNAGLEFVVDDFGYVAWNQFGTGFIPHFAVINGTTRDSNYQQWEVLHSAAGWYGHDHYRSLINLVDGDAASQTMTFAEWAALHNLPPGQDGPGDDPDGDGVSNLAESGCGMDPNSPLVSAAALGSCSLLSSPAGPAYRFHRTTDVTGITETIQIKRGGSAWEYWTPPAGDVTTVDQGDHEAVTIALSSLGESKLLIRRQLTLSP